MSSSAWVGLGFVATAQNASPDLYASWGMKGIAPQIAYGFSTPGNDPDLGYTRALLNGAISAGLFVAGWAWCDHWQEPEHEAEYHAEVAQSLGLPMFIANMEEPYDAHGDSTNPKMWAPDAYAQAFRAAAPDMELAVTTTPRWGSSGNGLRDAGACTMPQAFTAEVPGATIPAAVDHARSWGWDISTIRPLVQVYTTNGVRPDANTYNADAAAKGVGVVPYILEQAHDDEGREMISTLQPSILRPPSGAPPEQPEPEPPSPAPDLPFKRPLYPPDAPQKGGPSAPGSDIEAVRRATSRAGYAPWPQTSKEYSNDFAHGPMERFQRDHVLAPDVKPTGWYGSASHEALRLFIIPSGPNTGQYAFDAYSQSLYRSA